MGIVPLHFVTYWCIMMLYTIRVFASFCFFVLVGTWLQECLHMETLSAAILCGSGIGPVDRTTLCCTALDKKEMSEVEYGGWQPPANAVRLSRL